MRSSFDRISEASIADVIAERWGLEVRELRYRPVGAGAYHWLAEATDDERYFVTCDDLDTKPWLGNDRNTVFDNLGTCYSAASRLRATGLTFVIAPIGSCSGAFAERIDDRHSLSVFEQIDGEPGQWGGSLPPAAGIELISMLAELHHAPSGHHGIAERAFALPNRDALEAALANVDQPWTGGPLSEAARQTLEDSAHLVTRRMEDLDRFAAEFETSDARPVVTHGEPHPGNLIWTSTGLMMVDWDTVAIAPRERDLWMLADDQALLDAYEDLSRVTLDRGALAAYRLLWALSDLAAYTAQLRGEHEHDADADRALAAIEGILDGQQPSPYGTTS